MPLRIHGFAFSGCIVISKNNLDNLNKLGKFRQWIRQKLWQISKPFMIFINIVFLYQSFKPLFGGFTPQKEKDEHEIQRALDPNGTNSQLKHLQIIDYDTALQRIAWTNESKELAQLKPILRFILKCMVHVFLFDDFIAHAYNLFFGGLLIYRLLNCKELVRADQSHAFAQLSNVCLYIGAILLRVASLWVYETETVSALLHPEGALSLFVILLKLFFESLFFILHFISLSMNSMWFAYCLLMVTTSIEQLQQEMMQSKFKCQFDIRLCSKTGYFLSTVHDLDELTLSRLCTRLTRLHGHFQFIVTYFTVPITLSFVSTTINLIASCCFMIIGNQQLKIESTASSFIFCIGTLSLARLLLVCVVGDMPSDAVGRLVLTVYECKAEWTTNEWMHYRAVKRFKRDFRVIMLRVVFVRQSSILAVLAFALNYCLILLQTESYTGTGGAYNTGSALWNKTTDQLVDQ